MTFIKPKQNYSHFFLNVMFFFMIAAVLMATLWLIMLNNRLVDLKHNISEIKVAFGEIQTQSAELKAKTFSFFSNQNVGNLAREVGLLQEKNPDYLKIDRQWQFASQY